jgi:hypothetical protein
MSSGIDIKFIEERYQRMTDDEFVRIATQDAVDLTPEAMEVIRAEILKRGLDQNIVKAVEAQNRLLTPEEIESYCDIVSRLRCPACFNKTERLNGTQTSEVISYIFMTQSKKKLIIACPQCLDKANNKALTKTALFGWWGVPWGIIRTPGAIIRNIKNKRTNHSHDHNDHLRYFVIGFVGSLATYKENHEELEKILVRQNRL